MISSRSALYRNSKMKNETATTLGIRTQAEAAGYIGGALTCILQRVMPMRMWLLLAASFALLVGVFQTAALLSIVRMVSVYIVFVAVLVGTVVFYRR